MSILMRGVDMPKNCEECNFKGECRNYWKKLREAYTRPSWCPLVEVIDYETEPQMESLEQFRVGSEYYTDITHFGKMKGESITTNKTESQMEYEKYLEKIRAHDPHKDWSNIRGGVDD